MALANLHEEFATIVATDELLQRINGMIDGRPVDGSTRISAA